MIDFYSTPLHATIRREAIRRTLTLKDQMSYVGHSTEMEERVTYFGKCPENKKARYYRRYTKVKLGIA